MILQKYFAALLSITIVVLSALLAIPSGRIDAGAAVQLVSVGVAAIVTYLSPLVNISWKGILKTGAAVIAALISILYPIAVMHGIPTGTQIALMVLAGLNALGVEMGVQIRTDASELLVNPPAPPAASISTHDLVSLANATAEANAVAVGAAVTNAIATAPSLVTATAPTEVQPWVNIEPEPDPEPAIPELEPVDETLNPANRADDTVSINAANLVSE